MKSPHSRLFAAGPFIANGKELGESLFGKECISIDTEDSPVSQMILRLSPVRGRRVIQVQIERDTAQENDVNFEIATNRVFYSRWKNSSSDAVSDAINTFANESASIVYAKGPGTAQRWARRYAEELPENNEIPNETNDLITYLRDSIHPKCSLVQCLMKRVAYHHGGLPDFVREEIEELYIQREIDVLFCTSTLLEGVNLPADKIFITSPVKANEALTPFEFKNLTGRAGRLDQHLCGMIFCINIPNDDVENPFDAFRDNALKTVLPTINDRLATSFDTIKSILSEGKPTLPEEDVNLRGTVTVLRSQFLNSREHAEAYIATKNLTDGQKIDILNALSESTASMTMPSSLALKNPFVDPVLQEQLYIAVLDDPQKWMIRRETGFSTDFEIVFKNLDNIFHIIPEIGPRGIHEYYRNDLLTFAKLWLRGKPFRNIVSRALPREIRTNGAATTSEVDAAIKKAMEFISKDISFVTAKYFSVLSDMVADLIPEDEIDSFKMTLALPSMLELGCSDPKMLALITACVPRGAALKIGPLIPDGEEDPVEWLASNQGDARFRALPSIYHKIMRRCGIWE